MKKYFLTAFLLSILTVLALPLVAYATSPQTVQTIQGGQTSQRTHRIGDMGFHGGISESRHLPRTLETILLEQNSSGRGGRNNRNNAISMAYSEYVFLGGEPVLFEGRLEIKPDAPANDTTSGTYKVEQRVTTPAEPNDGVSITRIMIFDVQYRFEGSQVIYTYVLDRNSWTEVITTDEGTFTLDTARSSFVITIIEDRTPAVSFYRGDISAKLVYTGGNNGTTTVDKTGEFYGFSSAWSATETHRTNVSIVNDEWALQYQIRPSVTVNKELQYVQNEPTVISFEGNYRELHQSFAGLRYDIFTKPPFMIDVPNVGTHNVEIFNVFEQLPAPDLSFLRGHSAEDDIHRLFAMQILTGDPRYYVPNQAITRGQFLTALAVAVKLPVEEVVLPRARRGQQPAALTLFHDVSTDRPEYMYIQAINRAGIAYGRSDGMFYFDYPISRQEMIVTMIRSLGLTNMGLNPTVVSPFVDSDEIAEWAIRDINVALVLDLIAPDTNGFLFPNRAVSKGEAAAMLNNLLDYLRNGIVSNYADQIVNIVYN